MSDTNGKGTYILNNEVRFEDCRFRSNIAGSGGAVAAATYNEVIFTDCSFDANTASTGDGGAVSLDTLNVASFISSSFAGNTASVCGGGVSFAESEVTMDSTTVTSNYCTQVGGGICIKSNSLLTMTGAATLSSNVAGIAGGAVAVIESPLWENTADLTIENNTAAFGSGLFIYGLSAGSKLHDLQFVSNAASQGGTVFWVYDSLMTTEPAGLRDDSVVFTGNTAVYGVLVTTQPVTMQGPSTYNVSNYGGFVRPAPVLSLFDYYGSPVLSSDVTAVTISITESNCGENNPFMGGEDTTGVALANGQAKFEQLRVFCKPEHEMKIQFQADIGSLLSDLITTTTISSHYLHLSTVFGFRSCEIGEVEDNGECVTCPFGTYNVKAYTECKECTGITGVEKCYGAELVAMEGYWRKYSTTEEMLECPLGSSCKGGNATGKGLCATGYTGPLCGTCEDDFFLSDGECYECTGSSVITPSFVLLMLLAIISIATVGVLYFYSQDILAYVQERESSISTYTRERAESLKAGKEHTPAPDTAPPSNWEIALLWMKSQWPRTVIKLKIVITTFQIVAGTADVLGVTFPDSFMGFTNGLKWLNLNLAQALPFSCDNDFTYVDTLIFTTLFPIALCALLVVCGMVEYHLAAKTIHETEGGGAAGSKTDALITAFNELKDKYLNYIFYITYAVLPSVVSACSSIASLYDTNVIFFRRRPSSAHLPAQTSTLIVIRIRICI
jgi:hypothetical protein